MGNGGCVEGWWMNKYWLTKQELFKNMILHQHVHIQYSPICSWTDCIACRPINNNSNNGPGILVVWCHDCFFVFVFNTCPTKHPNINIHSEIGASAQMGWAGYCHLIISVSSHSRAHYTPIGMQVIRHVFVFSSPLSCVSSLKTNELLVCPCLFELQDDVKLNWEFSPFPNSNLLIPVPTRSKRSSYPRSAMHCGMDGPGGLNDVNPDTIIVCLVCWSESI